MSAFKIDPGIDERLGLLAIVTVCDGGWVDLSESIIVKAGEAFFRRWNESTVDDVVQTTRSSMPQDAPNSLDAQVYVDIITYLLKASGSATGSVELTADRDRLKLVRVTLPPSR